MAAAQEEKLFALPEHRIPVEQASAPRNLFALPQTDDGEIKKPKPIVFGDRPKESAWKPNSVEITEDQKGEVSGGRECLVPESVP